MDLLGSCQSQLGYLELFKSLKFYTLWHSQVIFHTGCSLLQGNTARSTEEEDEDDQDDDQNEEEDDDLEEEEDDGQHVEEDDDGKEEEGGLQERDCTEDDG